MSKTWRLLEKGLFDTHCHPLDYPDPEHWLKECQSRGVRVHAMSIDPSQYLQLRQLTLDVPQIHASLGLYPLNIDQDEIGLSQVLDLIPDSPFIGEVGLDFSEECPSPALQMKTLERILSSCDEHGGRIVSLHSRRAGQEVLNLVSKTKLGSMILHWYSGPLDPLPQLPEHVYFSVNTAMLRSRNGQALLEHCPRNRILLESDGPYIESGGKPVYPWDLKSVVESLSSRWNSSLESTLELLQENLARVDASMESASLRAPPQS